MPCQWWVRVREATDGAVKEVCGYAFKRETG